MSAIALARHSFASYSSVINTIKQTNSLQSVSIHSSSVLFSKKAGRHKTSIKADKPLTYEQGNKPDQIGVRKSWNTFNTSNFTLDGLRKAETAQEDIFIRKFIHGTWPRLVSSDVVIKRRANQIIICFMAPRALSPSKFYFLIGYTEEIMSYILKCIVKLELQTIDHPADLIHRYI